VGGHVEAAARRAARIGNGFFPARGGLDELPEPFRIVHDQCNVIGRDPSEIELTAALARPDVDLVRRFEDISVARIVMPPRAADAKDVKRSLGAFADDVLAKL
jgi:alkanesulfonate monooxygenase SsuD/methylene tetrahydromethanopterin reductase-like flavin-dependent oxidoreductase (luciferase family)